MTDGFEVDAERLSTQAGQFPALAERAGAIHRELSDALAETGSCWGGDSVGQSFAAAHTGPADSALSGLGGLAERLGSVGTRFADTATSYRDQDAAGARGLNAAGEQG